MLKVITSTKLISIAVAVENALPLPTSATQVTELTL